jgi:putative flippase GtrA
MRLPRLAALGRVRGIRYIAVGGFNTVFGLCVFATLLLLLDDHLHYVVILLITHLVAVLTAFVMHRTLVFQVRGQVLRDLWRFWSVYLINLAANLVLLPVGVEGLHLPPLLAQALILTGSAVASYVAHTRFSFVRKQSQEVAPDHALPVRPLGIRDRPRNL